MIEILSYLLGFLALIMVITAIHEAGHFYVAKFFKVKILDFSIGMGQSLKSWIGRGWNFLQPPVISYWWVCKNVG